METVLATCPLCRETHRYGAELIGRYTNCLRCLGRFYVEVPPLAQSEGKIAPPQAPPLPAAPDDPFERGQKLLDEIGKRVAELQATMAELRTRQAGGKDRRG